MHKRWSIFIGVNIAVCILLLAMTAANARGDLGDEYQANYLQSHPKFHGFLTPRPPYPAQARMLREQGTVQVRVRFAAKGKVEDVTILESSGSEILDGNSVNYIKRYWRNVTGKAVTRTLPLEYHLR